MDDQTIQLPPKDQSKLRLIQVQPGLWTVQGAYSRDYGFFDQSRVFGRKRKSSGDTIRARGGREGVQVD
jgi:hypothetical protein